MQRIAVIGATSSGKTTLAGQLPPPAETRRWLNTLLNTDTDHD